MITLALTLPGLVIAYFLYVRPVLAGLPQLKQFYAEADGFWQKVWALSGRSAVIVWSTAMQIVGWVLQWLDPIAATLGDPDFKLQVTNSLQANPKVLGYVLMGISAITMAARLRSLFRTV